MEYDFEEGVMWEDNPWKIKIEHECSQYGGKPCRHCRDFKTLLHVREHEPEKSTFEEKVWICPAVIEVQNESGCNTTGLCLQCLLEAVRDTKELRRILNLTLI